MNRLIFSLLLLLPLNSYAQSPQALCDTCSRLQQQMTRRTYSSYMNRCFQKDTILKAGFFYETKAKHFCKEITVISRYYHTDTIPVYAYEVIKQTDTAFTHSEKPAMFPGGEEAMMKYMIATIIYPREAERKEIEGRVTIQFYVSQTGKKYNYSVLRRADESLVAEALRVIQKMPDWEPGQHEGKPVLYKINIPVNFKLPK